MTDRPDDDPIVTLAETYPVAPELVWRAWTDPAILSRWYGCQPDQLWRLHEWEPHVGGPLHVSMTFDDPDGGDPVEYAVRGEFVVVDRPHRLAYTFGDGQWIDVSIEASPDVSTSTVVTVRHHGLPPDGPGPTEMAGILTAGWSASLAQLAAEI